MKYQLKIVKNEKDRLVFAKEKRGSKYVYLAKAENGEVREVDKDWIMQHKENIVNLGISGTSIYPVSKIDVSCINCGKTHKESSMKPVIAYNGTLVAYMCKDCSKTFGWCCSADSYINKKNDYKSSKTGTGLEISKSDYERLLNWLGMYYRNYYLNIDYLKICNDLNTNIKIGKDILEGNLPESGIQEIYEKSPYSYNMYNLRNDYLKNWKNHNWKKDNKFVINSLFLIMMKIYAYIHVFSLAYEYKLVCKIEQNKLIAKQILLNKYDREICDIYTSEITDKILKYDEMIKDKYGYNHILTTLSGQTIGHTIEEMFNKKYLDDFRELYLKLVSLFIDFIDISLTPENMREVLSYLDNLQMENFGFINDRLVLINEEYKEEYKHIGLDVENYQK